MYYSLMVIKSTNTGFLKVSQTSYRVYYKLSIYIFCVNVTLKNFSGIDYVVWIVLDNECIYTSCCGKRYFRSL